MDDKIHELIAAISPDVYCQEVILGPNEDITEPDLVKKIKKLVKEKGYTDEVLKEVKPKKSKDLPGYDYDSAKKDAMGLWGLKSPIEEHKLVYDSPAEGLEPIYFWLIDFLQAAYDSIDKITDNFTASPGSGHFSEMQGKATQMQQEASRTMGNVNTVLKSVLNLVYDLKEFRIRLNPYKKFFEKGIREEEKYKQLLSLKQIWLDNVDIRKGRGSINALSSGELDFVTLRDGFMAIINSELKDVKGRPLDLNERVKRILEQRAQEFFTWIDESYASLNQRFEIERNYLKSQVNMLKMYVKWVKPYLAAAHKLQQKGASNAALVNVFNTMILELQLIAKKEYDINDDVASGAVPELFKRIKTRKYFKILVLELDFRGIPQRVSQRGDWAFGGRTDIKFTSYALNNEELDVLKKELENDELNTALKLIKDATDESLEQIQKEITALLEGKEESEVEEEKKKKEEEEKKKAESGDDFGIKEFFSLFKFKKKDVPFDAKKGIHPAPDSEYEKVIRSQAILSAKESCFGVFDTYKKAHGMPSHTDPFLPL